MRLLLDTWFPRMVTHLGLHEVAIVSPIMIAASTFIWYHNDPADRILVATAIHEDMALVTADTIIAAFPDVRVIW